MVMLILDCQLISSLAPRTNVNVTVEQKGIFQKITIGTQTTVRRFLSDLLVSPGLQFYRTTQKLVSWQMLKTYMSSIHDCLAESLKYPTKQKAEVQKTTGAHLASRSNWGVWMRSFPRTLAVDSIACSFLHRKVSFGLRSWNKSMQFVKRYLFHSF